MELAKVYWSARNLGAWWNPFGNHHFVLIKNANVVEGLVPVEYKGEKFLTLGGFSINGLLIFEANNASDVQSCKDKIDGRRWEPDMDLQRHRVAPPNGSDPAFAALLAKLARNFERNSRTSPIPYELFGDNCSAWVNTIFKVAGVPLGERRRAGQFRGIDAGEQIEIPEELFKVRQSYIPPHENYPRPFPGTNPGRPGNGQRIHVVQAGDWLSKIAITYYGDMNKWTDIYNHPENMQKIGPDPNLIKPGQRLVIP
ncbi:MAG: LysM peptidoglycan-binding domain-containing protein [Pyrinomonadaceae bacterium]